MAIRAGKQNIPCICVTNRTLCRDDFLTRIDHIAKKGVADAILLREKDLTEREYLVAPTSVNFGRSRRILRAEAPFPMTISIA